MSRRLAAIMYTDIAGFTPLSQTDEPAALRLLREQERLVRGLLEVHQGRLVKSMGDGLLIEFPNVLDAVMCAVDLQRHIQDRNTRGPPPDLRVRIGVHLGDVEGVGSDILGDAVNVASRIEPLAEPGGVCLSLPVVGLVRNKVPFQFESLGWKTLKGVQEPLEVYRIIMPESAVAAPLPATIAGPPRLAVLPFANISPDPNDAYFADGMTEELTSVLSQVGRLRVIARTSVNQYRGTAKPVAQIGSELGVSSVLEGSVRKADHHLRIAVQLIDVRSQEHVWSATYDRQLEDVFAVQADVAKRVAEVLKIDLREAEGARLESRQPVRPESYLAYLKGRTLFSSGSVNGYAQAKDQFELAISLDPKNVAAYSGLADVVQMLRMAYQGRPLAASGETGRALLDRAIELDPNSAEAHTSLGLIQWCDFEYISAERETKLALSLNPSYSYAHLQYACLLEDEGRTDEALMEHTLAEETDPLSPINLALFARLLIWLGRYDEALVKIRKLGELNPSGSLFHLALAHYHAARSNREAWLQELTECEKLDPDPNGRTIARAWTCAVNGEKEQARALIRQLEAPSATPAIDLSIAELYAELGDLDECFRVLEKRVEDRFIPFQQWRLDPRLQHVRDDPRFRTILQRMNLA